MMAEGIIIMITPTIVEVPESERKAFDKLIKETRKALIPSSQCIVDKVLQNNSVYVQGIKSGNVSENIQAMREASWQEFLRSEVEFNIILMKKLNVLISTPKDILSSLVTEDLATLKSEELLERVKNICGDYTGRVFPYVYAIALSNTNSRRSRSGKTFEAIIYKTYETLNYPFDSQSKVGRKIFDDFGLGKKVDSILPSLEAYNNRRNKTIIGTMKTSLRERWQEVAEEIERTKIPEIHLLTADENISASKAEEMARHNIIIVVYEWIAISDKLKDKRNIISFEEYLFEEIPSKLAFWEK